MRVRAQFNYDPAEDATVPCLEAALTFHRGDILEIVSQDDAVWWQARHDAADRHITRVGLIPSRLLQERYNGCVCVGESFPPSVLVLLSTLRNLRCSSFVATWLALRKSLMQFNPFNSS